MYHDRAIWYLALGTSVLGYLLGTEPPDQWDYYDKLRHLMAALGLVSAWLAKSPLKSKATKEWEASNIDRRNP